MIARRPRKPSPLAAARHAAGLTQVQLAARIGVHPQTLAVAERGAISDALAQRAADALGLKAADILPRERQQ